MRIQSLTLGLATVATLSGCLNAPAVENASPAGPPPLRAWIGFPIGSSHVFPMFLNREAHVAMFEIIPGRGVTMVYPVSGADMRASEIHYANLAVQPGRFFYYSDPFGHSAYQPRYYYLVASVAPLNLTRLRSSLGATRKVLGAMYASYRPYDVIDRVTELVVPMQPDEDWATDVFVDWPMPAPPVFASTRLVTCANGRVFEVPLSYPYFGCPGDPDVQARGDSSAVPPTDSAGGDSVRHRQPESRPTRPRPELTKARDVAERRRAVAGARPPSDRARAGIPSRSRGSRDRFGGDDGGVSTSRAPSRPVDNGARNRETARETSPSRGTESSTPRSEPRSPSSGSEGTRKDP